MHLRCWWPEILFWRENKKVACGCIQLQSSLKNNQSKFLKVRSIYLQLWSFDILIVKTDAPGWKTKRLGAHIFASIPGGQCFWANCQNIRCYCIFINKFKKKIPVEGVHCHLPYHPCLTPVCIYLHNTFYFSKFSISWKMVGRKKSNWIKNCLQ